MGSHVWRRDGQGGSTTTVGAVHTPHRPPQHGTKRKLVWTRNQAQQGQGSAAAVPSSGIQRPSSSQAAQGQPAFAARPSAATQNGAAPAQDQPSSTTGAAPVAQHDAKRQRQAENGHAASTGHQAAAEAPDPQAAEAAAKLQQERQQQEARKAAAVLREKQRLRDLVRQKEAEVQAMQRETARLAQEKAAEAEAARRHQAEAVADKERRKQRLEAGFLEALQKAREQALVDANARKAPFADAAEVQRVLRSKTDADVLQVAATADKAVIRKKYKEMAVALHPDKCKVAGATDAFQRLVRAYQTLTKYAR